jgi:hypothetical protein
LGRSAATTRPPSASGQRATAAALRRSRRRRTGRPDTFMEVSTTESGWRSCRARIRSPNRHPVQPESSFPAALGDGGRRTPYLSTGSNSSPENLIDEFTSGPTKSYRPVETDARAPQHFRMEAVPGSLRVPALRLPPQHRAGSRQRNRAAGLGQRLLSARCRTGRGTAAAVNAGTARALARVRRSGRPHATASAD